VQQRYALLKRLHALDSPEILMLQVSSNPVSGP
jgi:hypothetical protein